MTLQSKPAGAAYEANVVGQRADRRAVVLTQATAVWRQLRQLLGDATLAQQPELRLALADELIQEIDVLALALQRPAVRQATARVRCAIGLPIDDPPTVPMPLETALAFLSLAIDPPEEMVGTPTG